TSSKAPRSPTLQRKCSARPRSARQRSNPPPPGWGGGRQRPPSHLEPGCAFMRRRSGDRYRLTRYGKKAVGPRALRFRRQYVKQDIGRLICIKSDLLAGDIAKIWHKFMKYLYTIYKWSELDYGNPGSEPA